MDHLISKILLDLVRQPLDRFKTGFAIKYKGLFKIQYTRQGQIGPLRFCVHQQAQCNSFFGQSCLQNFLKS